MSSQWDIVANFTYKEEDFPSVKEAKAYGLSQKDFQEYKEMFLGKRVPPRPDSVSDQMITSKGYRSWPHCNLVMGLANT